jgi:hypothetical protein
MDDFENLVGKACEWIDGYEDAMCSVEDHTIPCGDTPYEIGYRKALSVRAVIID